jgi:hypothetical protein
MERLMKRKMSLAIISAIAVLLVVGFAVRFHSPDYLNLYAEHPPLSSVLRVYGIVIVSVVAVGLAVRIVLRHLRGRH